MGKKNKKILKAKVAPSKQPRRADVVAVTSDQGREFDGTKLATRAMHGAGAELKRVDGLQDMVNFLAGFESIRRLVFMLHGSPGALLVGPNQVDLSQIASALKASSAELRCTELIFEACNVASGGTQVASLMDALQSHVASGYACFHGWDAFKMLVHADTPAQSIEASPAFRRRKRFIVPGQPTTSDMAKKPASYDLVVEYFSSTPLPDEDVFEFGLSGQVERLKDRSQLERKTFPIRSAKEAEQYDTPVGSMTLVTFVR